MIDEDRTMQLFGYASDDLGKGSHKKVVVVCEECGRYRVIEKAGYRDLCKSCSLTGEKSPHWNGGKITRVCEMCGKEFSTKPSMTKNGKGRFCSIQCFGKWHSETHSLDNSPGWKGGKVTKICEICEKEFSIYPARAKNGKGRFCSHKCQGKWESKAFCGENSPQFGKTVSDEARQKISATLQGISYDEWESFATNSPYCPKFNEVCRESNREKYDRRCFLSGVTEEENGRKLSVHHYDMNKLQGCDGHTWKLVPLCMKLHSISHTPTWTARIIYLLEHVWNRLYVPKPLYTMNDT